MSHTHPALDPIRPHLRGDPHRATVDRSIHGVVSGAGLRSIFEGLPAYMMIGIIVVIGVSQANRIIGGLLGVAFWFAVLFVGSLAYDQGVALGVPGVKFPRLVFYALCLAFAALHGFTAFKAYARKKQLPGRSSIDDDET